MLEFEIRTGQMQRAKRLLYRAVGECPLAKGMENTLHSCPGANTAGRALSTGIWTAAKCVYGGGTGGVRGHHGGKGAACAEGAGRVRVGRGGTAGGRALSVCLCTVFVQGLLCVVCVWSGRLFIVYLATIS